MIPRRSLLVAAAAAAVVVPAAVLRLRSRPPSGEPLDRAGVRLFLDSDLAANGALRTGRVARSDERARATSCFDVVLGLLSTSEWTVAPIVSIHFDPHLAPGATLRGPQTHAETGALLVPDAGVSDATVLAHELAHVAIASRRPRAEKVERMRRVHAVVDEGVADFVASVVTARSVLGDPMLGPPRDLARPPRVSVEGWAAVAAAGGPFDPHPLGWDLAAALYACARGRRDVRDDALVAAANADGDTIHDVLSSLVQHWPERTREIARTALREWVPPEFSIQ